MVIPLGTSYRRPIWVLVITVIVFIPGLSIGTTSKMDKPESISVAADAIGMYLKKIANEELFVLKMQEIFDSYSPPTSSAKSKSNLKNHIFSFVELPLKLQRRQLEILFLFHFF